MPPPDGSAQKKRDVECLAQQLRWARQHLGGAADFARRLSANSPELSADVERTTAACSADVDRLLAEVHRRFGEEG